MAMVFKSRRYPILVYVEDHPGSSRSEVAKALGVSYSTAKYHLEKMVSEGLIRKEKSYVDKVWVWRYYRVVARPLVAVIDSVTGYEIRQYDNPVMGNRVWLFNDKIGVHVSPVKNVRVEWTASVETEGHEALVAEITSYTVVSGEKLDSSFMIKDVTRRLVDESRRSFFEKFGNREFNVKDNFLMQRRPHNYHSGHGSMFEGKVIQWFVSVLGAVEKRQPEVIKEGVGYYATDEEETYPFATIVIEYAHGETVEEAKVELPENRIREVTKIG